MTGWLFILMSSGCSVLIAHLLRLIEFKKMDTLRVLTVNYLVATIVAFLTVENTPAEYNFTVLSPVIILSTCAGVIFIANFFIYSKSVFNNGVGVSVAAMRISLIIPVLLSTFWYQEYLRGREWIGILLVFITLIFLLPDKRNLFKSPYNSAWFLVLLFFFTGLGDSSLKVYEADFSMLITQELFVGFIFFASSLAGILTLIIRRNLAFNRYEYFLGAVIGIPNLYSAIFLIEALSLMSGGIVYSVTNLLTVIGATFLGILRWGDKLTTAQWIGLGLTLISILLLI
jgi:drug/metabolite transporter (DMT)-like permease